jgi:hypothetical protein
MDRKDFQPIPASWIVDPKVPDGTPVTEELQLLRLLRRYVEFLWTSCGVTMGHLTILEGSLYPAGSHIGDVELTDEMIESCRPRMSSSLENLTTFEDSLAELSRRITETLSQVREFLARNGGYAGVQREVRESHNRILRAIGEEDIAGPGWNAEDEDSL